MGFCGACGSSLEEGATFCGGCGTPVAAPPAGPVAAPAPRVAAPPPHQPGAHPVGYPPQGWSNGPVAAPPTAPVAPPSGPSGRNTPMIVALGLALLLVAGLGIYLAMSWGSTSSTEASVGTPSSQNAPAAPVVTVTPTPTLTVTAPSTVDPLRPPILPPTSALTYPNSPGEGCIPREDEGTGLRYGIAECKFWQESVGLLHGRTLPKGSGIVVCQADLARDNPVFTANQTNTWWVWVRTLTGPEDWFPLTAVSQGESNHPVPDVPLCQR